MTVRDKADRLIREKRVHFQGTFPDGSMVYWVDGDSGRTRVVTLFPDGDAVCDCPFMHADCAHILAVLDLHMPTVPPLPDDEQGGTLISPNDPIENIPGPRTPRPAPPPDEPPAEVLSSAQDEEIPAQIEAYRSSDDTGSGPEAVQAAGDKEEQEDTPATPAAPAVQTSAELDLANAPITWKTLTEISKTEFVPSGLRGKPAACLAAILAGREIGLGPMESLEHISIIDGSPNRSAALQLKLYRRAGHKLEIVEETETKVTLKGIRADTDEELTVSYSLEDAVRAKLVSVTEDGEVRARSSRGNAMPWESHTPDLLWARAVTRLVRRLASDAA